MNRKEVLKTIEKIWEANPNLRLGQILCSAGNYSFLYYAENEQIIQALKEQYPNVDLTLKEEPKVTTSNIPKVSEIVNPTYMFIHKGNECKRILTNVKESYFAEGWESGRKSKSK